MSEIETCVRPPPRRESAPSRRFDLVADYDGTLVAIPKRNPMAIGERMADGTIYAGMSPDTKSPMYVMPQDLPTGDTCDQAADRVICLRAHGHKDWRLPTWMELRFLFENSAAIGGFSQRAPDDLYWSMPRITEDGYRAYSGLQFQNGLWAAPGDTCRDWHSRPVRTPGVPHQPA